jgi:hypothetical protein
MKTGKTVKNGDIISVSNVDMILPMVGRLVDLTDPETGEKVLARIIGVNETTQCRIVPSDTKD